MMEDSNGKKRCRTDSQYLMGDNSAFSELVKKYQKSVHALAWQKVGDFQAAEEIAPDVFLQAYNAFANNRRSVRLCFFVPHSS